MGIGRRHFAEWWSALLSPERGGRIVSGVSRFDGFDRTVFLGVAAMYSIYGISMGMPRGMVPAVVSGLKLPLLYLLTLLVCFPPFYVLNQLIGPRVGARGCVRLLLLATSVNAIAIVSYAPASYFFTLTTSTSTLSGYRFLLVMHVIVFALAGAISLLAIHVLFRAAAMQLGRPLRPEFLGVFGGVYALVGTQMSWTLRPWVGSWAIDYAPFRAIEGSFVEALIRLLE